MAMASVIGPPVRRPGSSGLVPALFYGLGASTGGVTLGVVSGSVGVLMAVVVPVPYLLMSLSVVAFLAVLFPRSNGWPERKRQIPRWWVQARTPYGLLLAGWVLGMGVFTHVRYALFYVAMGALVVCGSYNLWLAAALGGGYGLLTGILPLIHAGTPDELIAGRSGRVMEALAQFGRAGMMGASLGGWILAASFLR